MTYPNQPGNNSGGRNNRPNPFNPFGDNSNKPRNNGGPNGNNNAPRSFWQRPWLYIVLIVLILFFIFTDTRQIGVIGSWNMIVYVLLTLLQNGSNMCITTSNNSYMADTIDYELDRSGRYIPAVVSGTYSLIDKLITSVAAVIATGAVAVLGYTTTMPQPTDAYTSGIFWMTLAIKYGLPMLGWVVTLLAMVGYPLTKEEMVNVQKRIADKKDALRHEVIAEHMQ